MMDMFMREVRATVQGPLAIVRLGSCGGIGSRARVGRLLVADQSTLIARNFDYFTLGKGSPYHIYAPVSSHPVLTESLVSRLKSLAGPDQVHLGMNASADSFYSSQGREDDHFRDENKSLIETLKLAYPSLETFEMESFLLLNLATVTTSWPIAASAVTMVFANRQDGGIIQPDQVAKLEEIAGRGILESLISFDLPQFVN